MHSHTPTTSEGESAMPRRIRRHLVLLGVAAALVGAACSPTENDSLVATYGLPDLQQSLIAHEWLLDQSDSASSGAANPVTLAFDDDNTLSGVGHCNSYWGNYTLDEDSNEIEITDLAQITRACEPELMDAEQEFLAALAGTHTADVTDRDRLLLDSDKGELVFDAFDIETEIVGTWSIVNLATGNALQSPIEGTDPTLTVNEDNTVVVQTGCNSLHSTVTLDHQDVSFATGAQTLMACEGPDDLSAQEASLAAVLNSADHIDLSPQSLTLLDESGSILLIATRS